MRGDQRRFVVLGRDLEFIYKHIEAAKDHLESGTPARKDLDLAEARFQSMALIAREYQEAE
jgi:hypothetical protein